MSNQKTLVKFLSLLEETKYEELKNLLHYEIGLSIERNNGNVKIPPIIKRLTKFKKSDQFNTNRFSGYTNYYDKYCFTNGVLLMILNKSYGFTPVKNQIDTEIINKILYNFKGDKVININPKMIEHTVLITKGDQFLIDESFITNDRIYTFNSQYILDVIKVIQPSIITANNDILFFENSTTGEKAMILARIEKR